MTYDVVLDTNVLVAAFRSKRGASYRLLSLLGDRRWLEDEFILELAVAGHCHCIVTYNRRDFEGIERQFGIRPVTPGEFLAIIEEKP